MGKKRKPTNRRHQPTLAFVALGCPKALVDAERMLADLGQAGFVLTDRADQADVIVVNTCGFLDVARQEALNEIRTVARYRRSGRCQRLIVTGCLVERDGERLRRTVPQIDSLVSVHNRDQIVSAALDGEPAYMRPAPATAETDAPRLRLTPRHYAYLRISEGCSQHCTFCTIPAIRGPIRSKPADTILREAHELIDDGAVELVLIGQETTSYGRDIGYEPGLAGLLRQLDSLDGLLWLRLMYAYPLTFTDEVIDAIAECPRVAKYVDLPVQHISDPILKAMGRRIGRDQTEKLLHRLRERVPGVSVRTTMLVGFPGESERSFEELLDFVKAFRFDALGAFAFSSEPGTPAADMPNPVPEPVKQERLDQLMLAQQQIAFDLARSRRGERFEVLVDEAGQAGRSVGRHQGQAPEIDSVTLVEGANLRPGDRLEVTCVDAEQYDLIARLAGDTL